MVDETLSSAESFGWAESDITVTSPGVIKRAVGAAAIGNVTEWFDFGVYSYLATNIESIFFPSFSSSMQTLATLGTFAVAFWCDRSGVCSSVRWAIELVGRRCCP